VVSGVGNGNGGWDGDRVGHVALALSQPGVKGWWKEIGDLEKAIKMCWGNSEGGRAVCEVVYMQLRIEMSKIDETIPDDAG